MKKLWPLLLLFVAACKQKEYNADLFVKNAVVYTVDSAFTVTNSFVVDGGRIVAVGDSTTLSEKYLAREVIDARGKTVYPGFIDAHAHFLEYGLGLQQVNLKELKSWQQVLDSVKEYATKNPEGWVVGNGWDQNLWVGSKFPDKTKLDALFPVRPVILNRVDGHGVIVNQAALNIAGIKPGQTIPGGEIETVNGKLTGVLLDNAVGIVTRKIPDPSDTLITNALLAAQRNCIADGLTTVDDCGLPYTMVNTISELQHRGSLKMRMYVLLSDRQENYDYLFKRGVYKTPGLDVRGFKVYADGALGSRGAALLKPYSDQANWNGFLRNNQKHFADVAMLIAAKGFQMATHAIGDSANRVMLKIYASVLKGKNDRRWRIEHSQVIAPEDLDMFGKYNIIPSVQPTHATSDMYWAGQRLGPKRLKTAYAYKQLLAQNGWLPLGTDFPVEDINPLYTFYAAVVRKDLKGFPAKGFQMENALTREEALRGMTIWAAKANFEEKEKGSIEVGKYADFVITDKDLMKDNSADLPKIKILKTYINGEKVYERK
ncbi:amidohydrolase [Mucilaginibacter sp. dw_454]|uniref:amidohydrolase n=1 Tax=Mucilaginibacter sp. dw_454 TaxID=2720079 RepID=UPI001BD65654|nr:amidohydrolase [Mucilaginibacter sp. dw_454]